MPFVASCFANYLLPCSSCKSKSREVAMAFSDDGLGGGPLCRCLLWRGGTVTDRVWSTRDGRQLCRGACWRVVLTGFGQA